MTLEITDLEAWYPSGGTVLHGVSLSVADGGITALLGANGAGKTTTLRAISGIVGRRGGIRFDGLEISKLRTDRIARAGIGHVPQGRGTLTHLSVNDNLLAGAAMRRDRRAVKSELKQAVELFPRLAERQDMTAGNLSGGEQQMLAIARALMAAPRLLLLDEPSLGLAPKVVLEVYAAIKTLHEETGVAMLVVEQNAQLALELADNAVVLETGSVALAGSADELRGNDAIRAAYLGG